MFWHTKHHAIYRLFCVIVVEKYSCVYNSNSIARYGETINEYISPAHPFWGEVIDDFKIICHDFSARAPNFIVIFN